MKRFSRWLAVFAAVAAAVYVVRVRARYGVLPAHDLYAYFLPKVLYALASLNNGGSGLLWNPYQNCGQPFFALSQTGLLYPPYLLFLVFDPELALPAVLAVQLAIGGIGAYLLCRELGARPLAALAGALAFEVGNTMVVLSISSPTHSAPFAWIPFILFCFERLLRDPSLRRAALLAVVLAIAILPGMPQTVFFTYQVIVLRLLFELATRGIDRPARLLPTVAIGLVLPVLLAAVQLLPEIENAGLSVRNVALSASEANPGGQWDLQALRRQLTARITGQPFVLVPCLLSLAGLLAADTRRLALFYAATAVLYTGLAFGPGTPLYDLYSRLPGGAAFRQPSRLLWMTSFCLAPLTALGVEAIASQSTEAGWRRVPAAVAVTALPLLALWWLTPNGLRPVEWAAAALVCAASCAAFAIRGAAYWAPAMLLAALVLQLGFGPYASTVFLFSKAPDSSAARAVFAALQPRVGPEDRVYLLTDRGYNFMQKSASVYRLPTVLDYEPLASRRFAELSVMLRSGAQMRTLSDFNLRGPQLLDGFSRRLFDLTAVRYVIATERYRPDLERITPPLRAIETIEPLAVYENPQRLPRAFYVPEVVVVPDSPALLERLATGSDDLRQIALVEDAPTSGFVGAAGPQQRAAVEFARNDPEDIVLAVDAPERGFVVLSDQYLPGWSATVDGQPVPIQRANYAFRLVEVPAGRSTVAFRYSPRSLWWGAAVSAFSAIAVAAMLVFRPQRSPIRRGG